jgi:hypothetical protein
MATKFDAIPEVQFDAVPEVQFDAVPDQVSPDVVAQEAQRASTGALQALDVMAAPRQFDWSDANEQMDRERFQAAEAAGAQALLAEERGSGTGPGSEAFQWRRERDFQLGQISPNTEVGRMVAQQGQRELQDIEQTAETEARERTPSQLLSGFMGPGLSATVQPVVESAARNIGPAAGGALGALALTPTPAGAGARFLLPLVGGFMGSQVGGGAQEVALRTTETPEETEARNQRAAEDFARNPWAARIGAMAASSPFFGPSLAQFGRAAVGDRGAIANLGIAGAIGGGLEMVNAALQGRTADAEDIAAGVFSNMIMNEPTRLGRRLGFQPSSEQAAVEAAQKYAELPPEVPTPIGADLQSGLNTRGTTSTADVFANVPKRQTEVPTQPEVTPDAQQVTQAGQIDGGVRAPEVTPENVPLPPTEGGEGVQQSRQGEQLVEAAPEQTQPEVAAGTDTPEIVGIRNALTDLERQRLGQPARTTPEPRGFEQIRSEAEAVLANDSQAGIRLVSELTQDIRPLNDTENALLTFELKIRRDVLDNAYRAINEAQTPEQKTAAEAQMAFAQNEHFNALQIAENAGTENAQALNSRKLILNEDFSLGRMLAEKQAVENGGQPLSKEQTAEVTKLYDRIKDLETKLQTAESTKAESAARKEYDNILKETRNEAKTAAKEKKSFVDFLDTQAEKARQRIIARRGRLQVTIDPLNVAGLVDEAIIGASHVARGLRDFGQWSKKMVDEFGERIRPHLDALFQRANELEVENAKPFITKTPKTREEVLESAQKIDRSTVFDLARAHINQGVEGFENVMGAVEQDLKAKFPDVTPRQIRDALSEYGKTSQPSKAEDLKKLREYRSISRLMSQLEDAQKGAAPLKTGPQRDKATARVRELQKQVNAAIKAAGLEKSGPERISTAHDARVTRLKNAIEETERAIESGKRPTPTQEVPWTPEELALKQQLAEAKERLDDVLGEPENNRLTSILKSIERAEEKIRTGDIDPRTGRMGPNTKEVTEATRRLKEANRVLSEMRKKKRQKENPPKTEDQKRLSALEKQRDALLDRISKGETEPKVGRATVDTQQQAAIRQEIRALNAQLVEARKAARPQKAQDEVQYNALQRRIENLSEAIAKGETEPKTGRPTAATERVARAKEQLAKLNKQMAEMRRKAQPQKPEDQAIYNNLVKRLESAEARLAAGDLSSSVRRKATVETQRVAETRAQLQDVNRQIQELRGASDGLRLERDKKSLRSRIQEFEGKISRGDYSEPPPKRDPAFDREKLDLEYDLAKIKQEWQKGLIEARRAKRGLGEKIWDTTKETFNLSRQLLTSGDLPPVFRQGLFAIGRPKMMASALKNALQAMVSEKKRFAIDREIQNRPNAPLYQRAKLYLAKDTGQPLSQQEEAYMGNWFKELPRWTGIGPFLRASERSYNTFLNKLRADTFDAAIKAYDIAPTETAHLRALADVINTMTGRAKLPLKSLEQGAGALNTFLFAPRFFASRLKLATGQPLWSGTSKSRKFALEQYGRTLAGASLIYGLAKMAGAQIETDPRSTDFLKIKIGNTRIDPLGGLIQITNFLTRVVTGETKTKEGVKPLRESLRPLQEIDKRLGTRMAARGKVGRKDAGDTIWDFGRTKLNPIVGASVDLTTGKDIVGRPTTVGGTLKKMSVPISFQDISETMQEQGVPKGTALWILSLFGAGLQTYGKR